MTCLLSYLETRKKTDMRVKVRLFGVWKRKGWTGKRHREDNKGGKSDQSTLYLCIEMS
jgi:hypothetical protein